MISKRQTYWLIAIVTILIAFLLQSLQEYRLYAKEAEHLWLNDSLWIEMQLVKLGGFVQVLTSFFTQFFQFYGVGAILLSVLFAFVFYLCIKIGRSFGINDCFVMLWLFPLLFMVLCHEHTYFNLKGHFAFAIALLLSYCYIRLFGKGLWLRRFSGVGVILIKLFSLISIIVFGYILVGSAIVVAVAVVSLYELLAHRNWWTLLVAIITFVLCAGFAVKFRYCVDMEHALTPLQYYEWPTTYFFPMYAWLSVPVILVLGKVLAREYSKKTQIWIFVGSFIVAVCTFANMYGMVHNEKVYQLRKDEWMARNEDWDGIIEAHAKTKEPTPFISYLNLALAKKGQLVQRMSEFNPYIVWSDEAKMYSPVLMTHDELSRDALKLQSCVFMNWGGKALANAQKSAFEANFL
ncbi:MAG: hypothetical protein HUJ97_02465, partial [Bacteroidales bacterium]|nr:hypothetical protein [Bacteroidales bacterium]